MNSDNLINIFAEFQKNMFREIGGLMGSVASIQTTPFDSAALEARILASVDARLKALETSPRVGEKRPRTPSIVSDDDDDDGEAPVSVVNYTQRMAPMAPVKAQQTILSFFEDKTVRDLTASLNAASLGKHAVNSVAVNEAPLTPATTPVLNAATEPIMNDEVLLNAAPAPVPAPLPVPSAPLPVLVPSAPVPVLVPSAPVPSAPAHMSVSEDEDEGAESDDEGSEEEEEDLTEINYKGKRYFMDGEYNIYGLDADGELIEEPVGRYDEKTRRITFD